MVIIDFLTFYLCKKTLILGNAFFGTPGTKSDKITATSGKLGKRKYPAEMEPEQHRCKQATPLERSRLPLGCRIGSKAAKIPDGSVGGGRLSSPEENFRMKDLE